MAVRTGILSEFKPYSFKELAEPYVLYKTEYDKTDEMLTNLLQDSGKVKSFLSDNDSPIAMQQYLNYMKDLNEVENQFAESGLKGHTKSLLSKLKGRYASEIDPISVAINRRQLAIEEFNKLPAGSRYIGTKPSDTSVDSWLNGATPELNGVNGKDIFDFAKSAAASASQRHYFNGYSSDGRYVIQKVGLTQDEVNEIFNKINNGERFDDTERGRYYNSILDDISSNIIEKGKALFGYDSLTTEEDQSKFLQELASGIYSGVTGSEKRDVDQYALEQIKHQHNLAAIGYKHKLDHPDVPPEEDTAYRATMILNDAKKGKYTDLVRKAAAPIETAALIESGIQLNTMLDVSRRLEQLKEERKKLKEENSHIMADHSNNTKYDPFNTGMNIFVYGSATGHPDPLKQRSFKDNSKYGANKEKIKDLDELIRKYELYYGPDLLSSSEYKKIKNHFGFKNDDFTLEDITNIMIQRPKDYQSFYINSNEIASSTTNKAAFDDILGSIKHSVIQHNYNVNIYETEDGVTASSKKLGKEQIKHILDDKNATALYIASDNFAESENPYVRLISNEKMYLVPAILLNASVYNALRGTQSDLQNAGINIGDQIPLNNRYDLDNLAGSVAAGARSHYTRNVYGRETTGDKGKN